MVSLIGGITVMKLSDTSSIASNSIGLEPLAIVTASINSTLIVIITISALNGAVAATVNALPPLLALVPARQE